MGGEATMIDFLACVSPPPAGPTAVDASAPPLSASALGIEDASPVMAAAPAPAPLGRPAAPASPAPEPSPTPSAAGATRPFNAELDACEIDERGRPETVWSARARELGRGSMVFLSRRMCYPGRRLVVLIHLIDHAPAPLHGLVQACEYESEGLYRVELRLMPMPDRGRLREWVDSITSKR